MLASDRPCETADTKQHGSLRSFHLQHHRHRYRALLLPSSVAAFVACFVYFCLDVVVVVVACLAILATIISRGRRLGQQQGGSSGSDSSSKRGEEAVVGKGSSKRQLTGAAGVSGHSRPRQQQQANATSKQQRWQQQQAIAGSWWDLIGEKGAMAAHEIYNGRRRQRLVGVAMLQEEPTLTRKGNERTNQRSREKGMNEPTVQILF